ncbi:Gfo/Idh/MocA family oxidoreductase [Microlunatus panaciterrae]|uniref:Dehydrogenase n=1 Tax=Microlunatus panaciterrae TaxID=400768 RepID=A0ABS2REN9_9ACTN|nr:Gfo/Idh/MocA family oxidoreductase [Microlunatus panaciterrae]MBM7797455.1 putative dehydrogenase [Microlunatus panaciterrae]
MSESTDRKIRAGVIGVGWAGEQHLIGYSTADDVEIVGLAGMEPDRLELLGDRYGAELRFADWEQLLAEGDLDVVSICTPTALHGPMAIAALNAGVHVLSEKPMAENADVARAMVDAARANDRVLDVLFNHRRGGQVKALKKIIDQGILGNIYYAKAGWLRRSGIPGLGSWFTKMATAGGGPMMDIGVHMLDMAMHLLNEPRVTTVSAATYAEFGPRGRGGAGGLAGAKSGGSGAVDFEVEDLSTAFMRLDTGSTLLLETSWASWIPHDLIYVNVYGSEGGATLELGGAPATYTKLDVWTEVAGVPAELQPDIPASGGHTEAVQDFLVLVRSGDWEQHRGEMGLSRSVVVDACYASAQKGAEVTVD